MSDATSPTQSRYGKPRPKVPAFARYEGTSAWKKNKRRVKDYKAFKAAQAAAPQG